MKQLVFLTVALFGFLAVANGQIEEKMEKENVVKGSIFKDGKEIEGYIKKQGIVFGIKDNTVFPAPWHFQSDLKFIPKDVFENTPKLKGNMYKKYGPKDISGYRYEDMEFEAVKYSDMSAVGLSMIPKLIFLRRIVNDKISIFYHYGSPGGVIFGDEEAEVYRENGIPNIVYRKGKDGKVKLVETINMNKDWEDCPYVKEKQENGEYDTEILPDKAGKLGGLLNKAQQAQDEVRVQKRLEAIADYNQHCN